MNENQSALKMWWHIKIFLLNLWLFVNVASSLSGMAEEMSCCSLTTGSCHNVCSQISLVKLGSDALTRDNASRKFNEFCSSETSNFWSCINTTLADAKKNENWVGRSCCHLIQYPICRSKCALAGDRSHLANVCRSSDELEFYSCLEQREEAERCCNNVLNTTCRTVCHELFHKPGKQSSLKVYTSKGCFHQVPKCLKNVAETANAENPKQYLNCCKEATSPKCLDACRKALYTSTTVREILDVLEEKCQPALPHSPLWSCFLQSTSTKSPRLPLDIGKLSCCSRATSSNCQNLCWRAFQADWEVAWSQLESDCLLSTSEIEMRRCLEDADEPCEMGCSGLSYCTKFNDRPTSLFRSCSSTADNAARWEADHWAHGGAIRGLGVAVRADPSCPSESLRAAACILQLRPCESRVHETQLCRADCMELMANCIDWTAISGPYTATTMCLKLSPPHPDMPCVSLRPFMENSNESEPNLLPDQDVSTPCKNNPCPESQICILQPNTIEKPYVCRPSCTLGEMSRILVPKYTWVQVPRVDQPGCHRVCQCTSKGLEKCRNLNCYTFNSCWIQDRFIAHRTDFYLDCNPCQCFEGEVTCSRKTCNEIKLLSLPCDCPAHYVPVCGRLGVTFASACLAKCTGLSASEVEFGSCSLRDPCQPNPCGNGEKCLRYTRVCLSPIYKPCKQYECVPMDCDNKQIDFSMVVCDRDNRQHSSSCSLVKSGAILAYRGPCLRGCNLRGPVCGINGEVYPSECAAWADKTVVDYTGTCVAVGLIGDEIVPRCGEAVKCSPLNPPTCIGVTPPGACCPKCGGAARIFYSRKQLDRIYYMMEDEADKDSVTLKALLTALERQLQVAQCSLRGYVTPESDIFILIQPTATRMSSSALQLRACIAETEKLVTRISQRSPKIIAEVPLGSLTRAEIAHGHISFAICFQCSIHILIVSLLIIGIIT